MGRRTDRPTAGVAAARAVNEDRGLDRGDLHDDPVVQFDRWYRAADLAGMHEPMAMILATAGDDGPDARYVLCRGWDADGFRFYTNLTSAKADQLRARPEAALCFPWHVLSRQVRVRGGIRPLDADEADAYFASRPRGSQVGAWASDQSRPLGSRQELEARVREVEDRFSGGEVPRPPHWGGYVVAPDEVELWQGRPDRLHDRFLYRRRGDAWEIQRLHP